MSNDNHDTPQFTLDCTPYADSLPEGLDSETETKCLVQLLAQDIQQLMEKTERQQQTLNNLVSTVENGGLKEATKKQQKLLDNMEQRVEENVEVIENLRSLVKLGRDLLVPITYTVCGGGLLYFTTWLLDKFVL